MSSFHLLTIPSWYPSKEFPQLGCFFVEQLQAFQRHGIQVGVIHPEVRPLKSIQWPMLKDNHFQLSHSADFGIPTWRLHGWNISPLWERGQMCEWTAACRRLMRCYIKTHGMPDIIHAHGLLWGGVAASQLSRQYGIPYIITEHNTNFLENRPLTRQIKECWSYRPLQKVVDGASYVTAVGSALEEKLALYFSNTSGDRLKVIPNMVKLDGHTREADRPPLVPFRFFSLGGLVERKNYPLLINAFDRAFYGSEHVELAIGGSGPEESALRALVKKLKLDRVVSFLGELNRSQVKEQLQCSHAFVHASNFETFGVAIVEALASGLPVIATNSGGPADIVIEDVGYLLKKGDMAGLSDALVSMRQNYARFSKKHIRDYAVGNFGEAIFVKRWKNLYGSLLAGRSL